MCRQISQCMHQVAKSSQGGYRKTSPDTVESGRHHLILSNVRGGHGAHRSTLLGGAVAGWSAGSRVEAASSKGQVQMSMDP
jgi:hypothetical protein